MNKPEPETLEARVARLEFERDCWRNRFRDEKFNALFRPHVNRSQAEAGADAIVAAVAKAIREAYQP